jgi:hypothetical protein
LEGRSILPGGRGNEENCLVINGFVVVRVRNSLKLPKGRTADRKDAESDVE